MSAVFLQCLSNCTKKHSFQPPSPLKENFDGVMCVCGVVEEGKGMGVQVGTS